MVRSRSSAAMLCVSRSESLASTATTRELCSVITVFCDLRPPMPVPHPRPLPRCLGFATAVGDLGA
uniref:Uncharacterized protein n=1 Tax=Arundo donax TaxID=35708 RepID=A0A0A9GPU9_ARUDO